MIRSLKAELVKLFGYSTFWVVIAMHALLFLMVLLIANNATMNLNGVETNVLLSKPYTWGTVAWLASWFNLILAILFIIYVGNDFLFGTFRRSLLDGFSRNQLFGAKLSMLTIFAIYVVVLVSLAAFIATPVLKSTSSFFVSYKYVLVLFVQVIGYLTFAMLFVVLTRNISLSIVLYLLYFALIEPIIRLFLPDRIAAYMPVKIISNLTPMPDFLGIMANQFSLDQQNVSDSTLNAIRGLNDAPTLIHDVGFAIIYIMFFAAVSYYIFRKRDF
jgi:ABC-type transport system involved in multi-copper enzyme maturation permease subunit